MITEIRERVVVRNGGTITVSSPELVEGSEVEVCIFLESEASEMDATEYLMSNEANREHLLKVLQDSKDHPERKVYIDLDELKKDLLAS